MDETTQRGSEKQASLRREAGAEQRGQGRERGGAQTKEEETVPEKKIEQYKRFKAEKTSALEMAQLLRNLDWAMRNSSEGGSMPFTRQMPDGTTKEFRLPDSLRKGHIEDLLVQALDNMTTEDHDSSTEGWMKNLSPYDQYHRSNLAVDNEYGIAEDDIPNAEELIQMLAGVHDDFRKYHWGKERYDESRLYGDLERRMFQRYGSKVIRPREGDKFDGKGATPIAVIETDDPKLHATIAKCNKIGFTMDHIQERGVGDNKKKVVMPGTIDPKFQAQITVYKYVGESKKDVGMSQDDIAKSSVTMAKMNIK